MHPALSINPELTIGVPFFTIALIVAISHIAFEHLETNSKRMVAREQFAAVPLLTNENDDRLINAHEQLIILPKQLPRAALSNPAKAVPSLIYTSQHPILHRLKKHNLIAGVSGGTGSLLVMDDRLAALRWYAASVESGRPFDSFIMHLTIPDGMGGMEAIQHLEEIDSNVKAIVCHVYSNDPVMSNSREYGFAGWC